MRILFFGDSITDGSRWRDDDSNMGFAYPFLLKAELGYNEPEKYEFFNRGIGGNRIVDLYARLKKDVLNLKPDVMSILCGVNDVWHDYGDAPNGVDEEKYYKVYDMMIAEIKEALPNIKIMIMEPFLLPGTGVDEWGYEEFRRKVEACAAKAKLIAEKYNLPFIPLQAGFDELAKTAPNSYWLRDGVHPTPMGHVFVKNQWLKAFEAIK